MSNLLYPYTVSAKNDSVRFDPLTPCQALFLSILVQAAQVIRSSLVITSGREGHGADDPHSRGEALDVRVAGLTRSQLLKLLEILKVTLAIQGDFTVLYEVRAVPTDPEVAAVAYVNPHATAPHIHLQPRKGTRWPPRE
ncbi:MAG: hypothetical protein NUV51_09240, partial [Sulfuricaulis sp.]|nr:hypothetical protein [Sulfuricaulis sp.]